MLFSSNFVRFVLWSMFQPLKAFSLWRHSFSKKFQKALENSLFSFYLHWNFFDQLWCHKKKIVAVHNILHCTKMNKMKRKWHSAGDYWVNRFWATTFRQQYSNQGTQSRLPRTDLFVGQKYVCVCVCMMNLTRHTFMKLINSNFNGAAYSLGSKLVDHGGNDNQPVIVAQLNKYTIWQPSTRISSCVGTADRVMCLQHLEQPCYVGLGWALIWGLYPDEGFFK